MKEIKIRKELSSQQAVNEKANMSKVSAESVPEFQEIDKKQGWVPFSRWFKDAPFGPKNLRLWQVFSWAWMKANHEDKLVYISGIPYFVNRGQFITGRYSGAEELDMPPSTFRNQLQKLKEMGEIDIEADSHCSVITIIKYETYINQAFKRGQPKDTNDNYNKSTNTYKSKKEYKVNDTFGDGKECKPKGRKKSIKGREIDLSPMECKKDGCAEFYFIETHNQIDLTCKACGEEHSLRHFCYEQCRRGPEVYACDGCPLDPLTSN